MILDSEGVEDRSELFERSCGRSCGEPDGDCGGETGAETAPDKVGGETGAETTPIRFGGDNCGGACRSCPPGKIVLNGDFWAVRKWKDDGRR